MPSRSSAAAAAVAALLLVATAALFVGATPARATAFTDAAGRRVMLPAAVGRVLPAERNAEVLVFVLAPDKLAAIEPLRAPGGRLLATHLPRLSWGLRRTPASMAATARRLGADLIIDAGPVTPARAAFADRVERASGIPYILVDDGFARMPRVLRSIGAILGAEKRADDLGLYAEHAIAGLRGRLLIKSPDSRPLVYLALGYDGLTTALPGSPQGAALAEAGAVNAAARLGHGGEITISPAQLSDLDPDIIIAERRGAFASLRRSPAWRRLRAARRGHIYLEPSAPFGWIGDPAGVNRLIGLHWLSSLFYPTATQEDLRTTVCDFYDRFYRVKLTNAQVEGLVRPAGAPPLAAPQPVTGPLVGLGAPPPSALPAGAPGTPTLAPAPASEIPGIPSTAPGAICTVPTGPSPQPLPGLASVPGAGPIGVPPSGLRGHPPAAMGRPAAPPSRY